MELIIGQLTSQGPVRPNNEDCLGFWQPETQDERRARGAIALLADGVGGLGHGEVASHLAVETVLDRFQKINPDLPAHNLLWKLFTTANLAVYDHATDHRELGPMATTLIVAHFRNNEISIGHVGDCRAYLIQDGHIERLTSDHSYVAMQLRMGVISEHEAATSEMSNVLTRSLGREPTVLADFVTRVVAKGDRYLHCSDGLYRCVTEAELADIVMHLEPEAACRELIALAEKRGTEDNLSVQVALVQRVEQLFYYRGLPIYQETEPTMNNDLQVGQVLDERFRITALISRSGMASVFKAIDLRTNKEVALKVPFFQYESDPGFNSRFQREEDIGKLLDHPYILHIVPVDGEKSRPYIAMEYLDGQVLRNLMRELGRLPVEQALATASHIAEALDHMHKRKIVHRDLKPENVMLCSDGSLRIIDFGIAKAEGLRRLTFTGLSPTIGTPDYMAPEQVKGKRGDERTDVYSLGAMLYEMVAGATPFEGGSAYAIMNSRLTGDPVAPRKVNPEISSQVEEIILHAMERNPLARYPSAAAMKAELDDPEKVELTGRCERLRPPALWRTRWHTVRTVLLAILVPVAAFGLIYLFLLSQRR